VQIFIVLVESGVYWVGTSVRGMLSPAELGRIWERSRLLEGTAIEARLECLLDGLRICNLQSVLCR
jgi:hypothetical protein